LAESEEEEESSFARSLQIKNRSKVIFFLIGTLIHMIHALRFLRETPQTNSKWQPLTAEIKKAAMSL